MLDVMDNVAVGKTEMEIANLAFQNMGVPLSSATYSVSGRKGPRWTDQSHREKLRWATSSQPPTVSKAPSATVPPLLPLNPDDLPAEI